MILYSNISAIFVTIKSNIKTKLAAIFVQYCLQYCLQHWSNKYLKHWTNIANCLHFILVQYCCQYCANIANNIEPILFATREVTFAKNSFFVCIYCAEIKKITA